MCRLRDRIIFGVQRASASAMVRIAKRATFAGFEIVDLTVAQDASALFPVVSAALELIDRHDANRLARMRRDVKRIALIRSHGSAGEWWPVYGAVALDVEHVKHHRLLSISMTIIHEATHARLAEHAALAATDRRRRERIERACVAQEIAFARRFPEASDLILGAKAKLDSRWWEQTSGRDEFDKRLEKANVPRWFRRMLLWVHFGAPRKRGGDT